MTHYLHFYELAKAPFSPSADSEFLYWNSARQELRQTLVRAIAERKGLMMLTGADGVGKTTLLHAVLERAALQPLKVIFVSLNTASPLSLFTTLVHELERDTTRGDATTAMSHQRLVLKTYAAEDEGGRSFRYLSTLLMEEYRRDVNVMLVIDDAHTSSAKSLLRLCHLTKLRVEGKALVQIMLVGRPALDETMDSLWLWRLRRQLAVRACVAPLAASESRAYLQRRLVAAAYGETPVLWPEGIALLAKHGQGIPRLLNMLGHDVLSAGLVAQQRPISTTRVRETLPSSAQKPHEHTLISRTLPFMRKAAGVAIAVGGMTTLSIAGVSYFRSEPPLTIVPSVTAKPTDVNVSEVETPQKATTREARKLQEVILQESTPPALTLLRETFVPQPRSGAAKSFTRKSTGGEATRGVLAKEEKVTKVTKSRVTKPHVAKTHAAGSKVSPPPQQRAAAKRSSSSRKNPQPPRSVSPSPAKLSTQKTSNDRLFDE